MTLALKDSLWILGALYLVVSAVLRGLLWFEIGREAGVTATDLPALLAVGLVNDGVAVLFLLLPVTLFLSLAPHRFNRLALGASFVLGFAWIFGVLYLEATEYYFFEEFSARFNLVAVDYLMYPHEVLMNIRDSYPVTQVWLVAGGLSLGLMALFWRRLHRPLAARAPARQRLALSGIHLAVVIAAVLVLPNHALAVSENRVSNEISANGVSTFFEALRTQEIDYHAYYHSGDPATLRGLLETRLETPKARFVETGERLVRRFEPGASTGFLRRDPGERLNVVILLEESFGAEFLGAYGASPSLGPEFDALAEQGLLFTRAYATGTRTVRGLEAVVASFPPIPSVSIVRRPGCEDVATWGGVLRQRGYHTSFLYGGYSYFDNMETFFGGNGYTVSDRADVLNPTFANIWGISDQDLMRHAIATFDDLEAQGAPFFSVVLTTSNHKPFTFPPGVPGVPEEGGGREAGVRYADFALGEFFRLATSHDWYDDTVFIVAGDHGARVYGAAEIPLRSYEIPILVLAPGRLEPRKVTTPISQMDLAPTVLGMLGETYEAPFFGQDVLALEDGGDRPLLFNHNHDVALLLGNDLAILGLEQSVAEVSYDRATRSFQPSPPDPRLVELTTAYYQTAYEEFRAGLYRQDGR